MKAIAVLTMFFLPGTFIAVGSLAFSTAISHNRHPSHAFFVMPLFNWEASNTGSVMSSRIWIYWAVTIPATILVWYLFQEWRNRIKRKSSTADFMVWLRSGNLKIDEEMADTHRMKATND